MLLRLCRLPLQVRCGMNLRKHLLWQAGHSEYRHRVHRREHSLGGNRVGANIALAAGALTVTVALALTRTEADGIRVVTPEGKNVPSTTLDLSVLGSDGKSIDLKAGTDAGGKLLRRLHPLFRRGRAQALPGSGSASDAGQRQRHCGRRALLLDDGARRPLDVFLHDRGRSHAGGARHPHPRRRTER